MLKCHQLGVIRGDAQRTDHITIVILVRSVRMCLPTTLGNHFIGQSAQQLRKQRTFAKLLPLATRSQFEVQRALQILGTHFTTESSQVALLRASPSYDIISFIAASVRNTRASHMEVKFFVVVAGDCLDWQNPFAVLIRLCSPSRRSAVSILLRFSDDTTISNSYRRRAFYL